MMCSCSFDAHDAQSDNSAAKKMLATMQKTNPDSCYGIFSVDEDAKRLCFYAGVPAGLLDSLSASDWTNAVKDLMQGKGAPRDVFAVFYSRLSPVLGSCASFECSTHRFPTKDNADRFTVEHRSVSYFAVDPFYSSHLPQFWIFWEGGGKPGFAQVTGPLNHQDLGKVMEQAAAFAKSKLA